MGRQSELSQLLSLLAASESCLVNVTGARGTGKSTLVRAASERVAAQFGVIDELDLADRSPADALGQLTTRLGRLPSPLRQTGPAFVGNRVLLVIFEADALVPVASRTSELLADHPGVTVLAESGPRLQAPDIDTVEIGPLPHPDAVALMVSTARTLGVPLPEEPETVEFIDRVCVAVQGNPLAVELAATRLQRLPLVELARLLAVPSRALSVLLPAGDAASQRYRRRLQADHDSMPAAARHLLDVLPVFGGSFSLQAAEAVGAAVGEPDHEALGQLVDQRLVAFDPYRSAARYRLEGLVRGFAAERFAESSSAAAARAGHAGHYARLARQAAAAFDDADEDRAGSLLGEDYDEALVAADWLSGHDPVRALELLADLAWEARRRGQGPALAALLERHLRTVPEDARTVQRDALLWWVQLQSWAPASADLAAVIRSRLARGLDLARELGEPLPLLRALRSRYLAVAAVGDVGGAIEACTEGVRLATELGHARWIARFEISLSSMHHLLRQFDLTATLASSGLSRALRAADRRAVLLGALVLHGLPAEYREGVASLPTLASVLQLARELGDQQSETHALTMLAYQAVQQDDPESAVSWLLARQQLLGRSDLLHGLTVSVMLGVLIGGLRRDRIPSARLHGAISSHVEQLAAVLHPDHVAHYDRIIHALADELGEVFEAETAKGRLLTREQTLVELTAYLTAAAAVPDPATGALPVEASSADASPQLTPRELSVLALLARGLRNKEIAQELGIAPKTVMHHTSAIYRKLAARGRSEAVVSGVRLGLVAIDTQSALELARTAGPAASG